MTILVLKEHVHGIAKEYIQNGFSYAKYKQDMVKASPKNTHWVVSPAMWLELCEEVRNGV